MGNCFTPTPKITEYDILFDKDTRLREFEFPNVIGGVEHEKSPGIGSFSPPNVLIVGKDGQQNTTVAKTILYG